MHNIVSLPLSVQDFKKIKCKSEEQLRCNECLPWAHTYLRRWLASLTLNQTACFYLRMGVAGRVAQPWTVRPTGNTPAIPDGTMHLTTNLLNLHIDINCALLWKQFASHHSFPLCNYPFLRIMFAGWKKAAWINVQQHIVNLTVVRCCQHCFCSITVSIWHSQICSVLM